MPHCTAKSPSSARRRSGSGLPAEGENSYWGTVTATWLNDRFGRAVLPSFAVRASTRRSTPRSPERRGRRAAPSAR